MKKSVYNGVTLSCIMQEEELKAAECRTGVISMKDQNFVFEESIQIRRKPKNPKLFDGEYISMVRMQNGKYRCHLKMQDMDRMIQSDYPFNVYCELQKALSFINSK